MGLAFFLLAVLYQTISLHVEYQRLGETEMRRPQIARTLLHRIAAELRSVPPARPQPPTVPTDRYLQALLTVGEPADSVPSATVLETTTPQALASQVGSMPPSFRLLGTSTRLLLFVRRTASDASDAWQNQGTAPEHPGEFSSAVARSPDSSVVARSPDRATGRSGSTGVQHGVLRAVLFLAKPIPPAPGARETPIATGFSARQERAADTSTGDLPESEPQYRGVVRLEIRQPFSPDGQIEALLKLREVLGVEKAAASGGSAQTQPTTIDAAQAATKPMVDTAVLTEEIAMLRFRYHDGSQWLDRWDWPEQLPAAVEISVSFDPRAADPEYVAPPQPVESSAFAAQATPAGQTPEEPLFPYRLVVALPAAAPSLRPLSTASSAEPQQP